MISGRMSDPQVLSALDAAKRKPDDYVVMVLKADGRSRSPAQNQLYRSILRKLAQQQGGSVADWNEALVGRYLGYDDVLTEDGEIRRIPASTSSLTVSEFSDFLSACLVFAHEHQVHLG